jgi:RNA polymerase sigma-70 factor (ECF subfamily)
LLAAAQAGDRAALEQLVAQHERPLLALCHGILAHVQDAEDAAQETFLRALSALPRYQPGEAPFRAWLFRIAVNVCLNRKRDRRPTAPWDEAQASPLTDAACPETLVLRRLQVADALQRLSPRHRAIFLLKVLEGWSVAEIGAAVGWNRIRVQNALARARQTLAKWRAEQMEGDEG